MPSISQYTLFVSYADADHDWVEGYLGTRGFYNIPICVVGSG